MFSVLFCPFLYVRQFLQERRKQMMNDVRNLCESPDVPGLVQFLGAYHCPEQEQVL